MAARRKLLGNAGDVLRQVRDPVVLYRTLSDAGLSCLDTAVDATGVPIDGTWLEKARKSGGGTSVRRYRGQSARGQVYYQRYIAGTPVAAGYVAARGRSVLLGITEQLIGASHVAGENFRYVGSIGPLRLSPQLISSLDQLGNVIACRFAMTGLFGVDGVLVDEAYWPVEVNPRYTASMELLERAHGRSMVGWHVDAAGGGALPNATQVEPHKIYGKTIAFAPKDLMVDDHLHELAELTRNTDTMLGDITPAGTRVAAGSPLVTILAQAATRDDLLKRLQEASAQVCAECTTRT
jgi:predicted ATP-grasp superfamily ATP-dependent carboligase